MSDMKKEITFSGLRRTSTFNIYAILENPSELILAQDILNAEIDGVIVNTPVLARTVAGVDRNDVSTKYDLGTGNMFKMVSTAIESASGPKKKVVVICQNNRALVKHCVNNGVYGVSVEAGVLDDMKHLVSEEELKLVLGR
jgi:phosphoenolpyruvate synthase/pyruvate phosphate dikinase